MKMKGWHKLVVMGLTVFAGLAGRERSSAAIESVDNTPPFSAHLNATLFGCWTDSCFWLDLESVSPAGDVDYFIVTCGSLQQKMQNIEVDFQHSSGDLDIEVYQLDGTFVGGSYGVGNSEIVYTSSANANGLVLKVYGYLYATNTYSVWAHCG